MRNYLQKWIDQLKCQRLKPLEKLADMLLKHLDGIVNYCRTKVRFGVVEAVNGNIRMLINRGRGYKNLRYLLLKAKRMAVTNVEFVAVHTVKEGCVTMVLQSDSRSEPNLPKSPVPLSNCELSALRLPIARSNLHRRFEFGVEP